VREKRENATDAEEINAPLSTGGTQEKHDGGRYQRNQRRHISRDEEGKLARRRAWRAFNTKRRPAEEGGPLHVVGTIRTQNSRGSVHLAGGDGLRGCRQKAIDVLPRADGSFRGPASAIELRGRITVPNANFAKASARRRRVDVHAP